MYAHILAVAGLAAACAGWVGLQRWIARRDPEAPGVEGRCGSCRKECDADADAARGHNAIHGHDAFEIPPDGEGSRSSSP